MGAEPAIRIDYLASPTLAKFHGCNDLVRGIRGPIGSGKSVGCCIELFARAQQQAKGRDGKRRTRWAVIRNTYPELKSTTIKTFLDWFEPITRMVYDAPIVGIVEIGDVVMEIFFLAMDKPKDVKKLLSLEITGAFLNEARELPKAVLDAAIGRCGRYPAKRDGGCTWSGVIMDTNPPDDSHWWYKMAQVECPKGWKFFHQPPALLNKGEGVYIPNPRAENVENHTLGFEYWMRQLPGKTKEWIKVYILGEYGSVHDGHPVYGDAYNDDFHCALEPLVPFRGIGIMLGWDYGRTPACIIGQPTPQGQMRILDELVVDSTGPGMGIRAFTRDVVYPHLMANYAGIEILASGGDPSGATKDGSDLSCFDIQAEEGIPTQSTLSNDLTPRLDAVGKYLKTVVDGKPGFLLSPKCTMLRKGFMGGYRYVRIQLPGEDRYREIPDKNRFSHPHDALQYLCQVSTMAVNVRPTAQAMPVTRKPSKGWT